MLAYPVYSYYTALHGQTSKDAAVNTESATSSKDSNAKKPAHGGQAYDSDAHFCYQCV